MPLIHKLYSRRTARALVEPFHKRLVAWCNPAIPPPQFTRRTWLLLWAMFLLLLLPVLAFPLNTDGAFFLVNARKLLAGYQFYRDIVDYRPPGIFYVYAAAIGALGPHQVSVRILDFLLQAATLWLLVHTVRRATGHHPLAALAAAFYVTSYVALSPASTAQSESYTGLAGLAVLYLLIFYRNAPGMLAAGALCGILYLLKPPLAAVGAVAVAAHVFIPGTSLRQAARNAALMLAGAAFVGALFAVYLWQGHLLPDYQTAQQSAVAYAGLSWIHPSAALWLMAGITLRGLLNQYPAAFTALTCIAALYAIRPGRTGSPATHNADAGGQPATLLLRVCLLAFAVMLLTIVAEGKTASYRFGRLHAFGVIPAACGALLVTGWIFGHTRPGWPRRAAFAAALLPALALGPAPRYLWHSGAGFVNLTAPERYDSYYNINPATGNGVITEARAAAAYIAGRSHLQQGTPPDTLLALGTDASLLYMMLDYVPESRFVNAALVTSVVAPKAWITETRDFLARRPRFVTVQTADRHPEITGSGLTTDQAVRRMPGVDSILNTSYAVCFRTGALYVYERK